MSEIRHDFTSEEFSKKVTNDLKAVGMEKLLEKGSLEFVMKSVESKELFSDNVEIIENLKQVKNESDLDFPVVGNRWEMYPNDKTELVGNDEVHSFYIGKDRCDEEWYETFSTLTDGLFMFQRSYISGDPQVYFESVADFVINTLVFAKQFYDGRLGKNDKIDFEWKLTKIKGKGIASQNSSNRMNTNTHNCEEEEIVLQRTYEYGELENCINCSAKIVGEICENFGKEKERWTSHAKEHYDKLQKRFWYTNF